MPNNVSRLGLKFGNTDDMELFHDIFSGEVLSKFDMQCKFKDFNYTRKIDHGKSATFAALGEAEADYHSTNEDLLQNVSIIPVDEFIIHVDGKLISRTVVDEVDELMNHFETRNKFAEKLVAKLVQRRDSNVAATGILAARHGPRIPNGVGGSIVAHADMKTDTEALVDGIFMAAERLDDKDVTPNGRGLFVRPSEYYRLIKHKDCINHDIDGNGSISKGTIHELAGFTIIKTNNLPNKNVTTDKAKYNGDFSKTVALAMTEEAVGTVELMGLRTSLDFIPERDTHLLKAKFVIGHGVLRPECAVEIAVA